MSKNCGNCYWKDYKDMFCFHKEEKPKANICDKHDHICNECGENSEYKYNNKYYCGDCLLKEFDVVEYATTRYYVDGKYVGSDEDMDEVINNLSDSIEVID